jgi:hypothetical protein
MSNTVLKDKNEENNNEYKEILERCNREIHTISKINYWKDKFNEIRGTSMTIQQFKILFNMDYSDYYLDDFAEKSLDLQYNLEYKRLL